MTRKREVLASEDISALPPPSHRHPMSGEPIWDQHAVRALLSKLRAPVADNWQQYALPGETTAEQVCERMNAEVTRRTVAAMRASAPVAGEAQHPDDVAVERFAIAMKAKLAEKRKQGYGGWDDEECPAQWLSQLLRAHVEKGDPLDVGNFAMMLHQRGERITDAAPQASEAQCSCSSGDGSLRHPCAVHGGDHFRDATQMVGASEAVRDALMAFDEAMKLCDDFPELQHHRDALRFAVQKARAALSAQPGAQKYCQWQPIETAPKDEVILLFGGLKKDGKVYAPHINVGYWTEQFGWTCLVHSHQEFAHIEPTHWMPRPPFPAQAYPDNKEQ
ncbi:hypothetical protein [Achromobacter sp. MFA1 R4]|uniref:hypothetical protein n=1 Tax=Achromobacter sp. MFA1 R4 TaxID=1881016 RepID=UPI0009539180|nr:hypothetical protein [Achromobacter sp. MFA1 R4]SIT00022.1 hypothetical protein SAMN05428937_0018 [Achromobacter sp. MFA1 R4]SIT27894.1 hypothetical protein SAMN05428937_3729 [Achromobacter sp. MFA1 R4]